ncbi:MAG: VOC family protein [Pseudomonadales bacterium]
MIGYVTIGVKDMERAKAFWSELLADMGCTVLFDMGRIAMLGRSMEEPMLAVCIPYDESEHNSGNGNMVAFAPGSREMIDKLYAKALELGGTDEGEPGVRVEDVFYGAYFRDPDGNKAVFYEMG